MNRTIKSYSRIVIKIGSALLVDDSGLRRKWMESLIEDVAALVAKGKEVLIVSSGAIALGRQELPDTLRTGTLKLEESQALSLIHI